jgi:hypothetical protein
MHPARNSERLHTIALWTWYLRAPTAMVRSEYAELSYSLDPLSVVLPGGIGRTYDVSADTSSTFGESIVVDVLGGQYVASTAMARR